MNWELNSERELLFTFENIQLPTKNMDTFGSLGYVQFFINPVVNLPPGTNIDNDAILFFDSHDTTLTENVRRTIRIPTLASSTHIEICAGDIFQNEIITNDTIIIDTIANTNVGLELEFLHVDVFPSEIIEVDTVLQVGDEFNGILIQTDTTIVENFIDVNQCEATLVTNILTTVSNDNLAYQKQLLIFPNPTSDEVIVDWGNVKEVPQLISIFDVNGKILKNIEGNALSGNQITIAMGSNSAGLYLIKIKFNNGIVHQKLTLVK